MGEYFHPTWYFLKNPLKHHVTCTTILTDEHNNYKHLFLKNNPHVNIKILLLLNKYKPEAARSPGKDFLFG